KIPTNIHARLRAYVSFVEPAEKGPPLRWRLTEKGLEHLRAVSGLELSTAATDSDFGTDLGIICALEQPELEAVVRAFGVPNKWKTVSSPRFPHVYRGTTLTTSDNKEIK